MSSGSKAEMYFAEDEHLFQFDEPGQCFASPLQPPIPLSSSIFQVEASPPALS